MAYPSGHKKAGEAFAPPAQLKVAGAGPAPDRRATRDGYQLHAASGRTLSEAIKAL